MCLAKKNSTRLQWYVPLHFHTSSICSIFNVPLQTIIAFTSALMSSDAKNILGTVYKVSLSWIYDSLIIISHRSCCLSTGRLSVSLASAKAFARASALLWAVVYFVLPCCRSESGGTHCCLILLIFHTDPHLLPIPHHWLCRESRGSGR